jgi:hypothetical protein
MARSWRRRTFVAGVAALGGTVLAGPVVAEASADTTYAASGGWHAAVHTLAVTGIDGRTVAVPVRVYALGAEHLPQAVNAQVTHTTAPDGRGGTSVQVQVAVLPGSGRSFPVTAAVRIADMNGRERMVAQHGGTSGTPITLRFALADVLPR